MGNREAREVFKVTVDLSAGAPAGVLPLTFKSAFAETEITKEFV